MNYGDLMTEKEEKQVFFARRSSCVRVSLSVTRDPGYVDRSTARIVDPMFITLGHLAEPDRGGRPNNNRDTEIEHRSLDLLQCMNPEQLSHELREGAGDFLEERRGIIALSLAAIGCMGLIVLYQAGIIKHLPEPDIRGLDADKVDASEEAYSYFETPDAAIGLGSYAVTLGLAAMGGKNRTKSQPWIPLALAAKTTLDAAQAIKLTYDQFARHKAACMWCLIAAAATIASMALAVPEATVAARRVGSWLD